MAHYAFLHTDNIVTEVITGKDEGEDGIDWEKHYGEFRQQTCKRTSYNTRGGIYYDSVTNEPALDQSKAFRKNYAGVGYIYDVNRDAFIPPQPFISWILDEFSCDWKAPIPYPTDGKNYLWDELNRYWKEVENG